MTQLSGVKDFYVKKGVRPAVADFLLHSWRPGTRKNYGCNLTKWYAFCELHGVSYIDPSIGEVLDFLYNEYSKGLAYSTMNAIRSSLSQIIVIDNRPVGQHPYVVRLLRSVAQERPASSKYNATWSINTVMQYLESLGSNNELSLELLTKKLLMLMAILSGVRGQIFNILNIDYMSKDENRVAFRIMGHTKTSKPGKATPDLVFRAYPHDPSLCVLLCLNEYLVRTDKYRKKTDNREDDIKLLFLTHGKPNCAASRSTIARWFREVMEAAGINMNIFSSHSVRTASVSAGSTRLPRQTILKAGGWTSATTFSKFYKKTILKECELQDAIMQQTHEAN